MLGDAHGIEDGGRLTGGEQPGRCCSQISAMRQRLISRGLATMSLPPPRRALLISTPMTGWAVVVLVPMARIQEASPISPMELVMAPLPKLVARPATAGAWW